MKTFFVSCLIVCLGYNGVTATTANFLRKDQQLNYDAVIASTIDTMDGHDADIDSVALRSAGRQLKSGKIDKATKKQKKPKSKKPKQTRDPTREPTMNPAKKRARRTTRRTARRETVLPHLPQDPLKLKST